MEDLQQERKDEMRQDMLEDELHERLMVESVEYFGQWTIEKFNIKECSTILDVVSILNTHLAEYNHSVDDVFEHIKGI